MYRSNLAREIKYFNSLYLKFVTQVLTLRKETNSNIVFDYNELNNRAAP